MMSAYMQKIILISVSSLFMCVPGYSQNIKPDTVMTTMILPELEILDSGIMTYQSERGYSLYSKIFSRSDQVLSTGTGLQSVLRGIPGIQFSDRGTQAVGEQLTMRGSGWRSQFGVRGLHIIEDGFSVTSLDGQTNMEGFNSFFIHDVHVFRGPGSLLWGNGGGGVIYLSTFRPDEPAELHLRTQLGSHQMRKTDISLVQHVRSGKRKLTLSSASTDGFREYSASQTLQLGFQQLMLMPGNWIRQHKIRYAGLLNSENPGTLDKSSFNASPYAARSFFKNSLSGKTTHDLLLGEKLHWNKRHQSFSTYSSAGFRSVTNPLPFGYIEVSRQHATVLSMFTLSDVKESTWSFGTEVAYQKDRRKESNNQGGSPASEPYLYQNEQLWSASGFLKVFKKTSSMTIEAGLRADYTNIHVKDLLEEILNTDDQSSVEPLASHDSYLSLLPALSFLYRIHKLELYASLHTAFENPTLSELSNLPTGGTGINPLLKPEKTIALESGIRADHETVSYDVTLFRHDVSDLLLPYQMNPDGEFYFSNEGNAVIKGIELWLRVSKYLRPKAQFSSEFSLSFTDAAFKSKPFEGYLLPGVSPLQLNLNVDLQMGNLYTSLSSLYRYRTFVNNVNSEYRPSLSRIDLKLGMMNSTLSQKRPFSGESNSKSENENKLKIHPFIQIVNITNHLYSESISVNAAAGRYYAPVIPRSFFGGISLTIR